MTEHDDTIIQVATERFERRLAEEYGKLRVDLVNELGRVRVENATESGKLRAEMAEGFGDLRAEMADRNAELLKWGLIFGATQTGAIAAVMMAIR